MTVTSTLKNRVRRKTKTLHTVCAFQTWNCTRTSTSHHRYTCKLITSILKPCLHCACPMQIKAPLFFTYWLVRPLQITKICSTPTGKTCVDRTSESGQFTKSWNCLRGHSFMTSTKKSRFRPPSPSVHMGRTPPCGRPHTVNMKYTPLSWNG